MTLLYNPYIVVGALALRITSPTLLVAGGNAPAELPQYSSRRSIMVYTACCTALWNVHVVWIADIMSRSEQDLN